MRDFVIHEDRLGFILHETTSDAASQVPSEICILTLALLKLSKLPAIEYCSHCMPDV